MMRTTREELRFLVARPTDEMSIVVGLPEHEESIQRAQSAAASSLEKDGYLLLAQSRAQSVPVNA